MMKPVFFIVLAGAMLAGSVGCANDLVFSNKFRTPQPRCMILIPAGIGD